MLAKAVWLALLGAAMVSGCVSKADRPSATTAPAPVALTPEIGAQLQADFDEAAALVAQLRYSEAAVRFADLAVRFEAANNAPRTAESLFWLGFCREKQSLTAEATQTYHSLVQKFSGTSAARQAQDRLARLAEAQKAP